MGKKIRMHVAWCAFCAQRASPARDVGKAADQQLRRLADGPFVQGREVLNHHQVHTLSDGVSNALHPS